jgi:hypothetical protein
MKRTRNNAVTGHKSMRITTELPNKNDPKAASRAASAFLTKNEARRTAKSRDQSGARLLTAAGEYLQEIGWAALVASVDRIQGVLGGRAQGQYELVIRFTGGKKGDQ